MRPIYTILKLLLILFFFGAGGCQQDPSSSRENLARVVVAMDATFIPMSFMNSENQLDGFEVDLLKELAQDANFVYELVNVEWGGLFGGLVTKKFDLVISSVGIIEERKKKMAFVIKTVSRSNLLSLIIRKMPKKERLRKWSKKI